MRELYFLDNGQIVKTKENGNKELYASTQISNLYLSTSFIRLHSLFNSGTYEQAMTFQSSMNNIKNFTYYSENTNLNLIQSKVIPVGSTFNKSALPDFYPSDHSVPKNYLLIIKSIEKGASILTIEIYLKENYFQNILNLGLSNNIQSLDIELFDTKDMTGIYKNVDDENNGCNLLHDTKFIKGEFSENLIFSFFKTSSFKIHIISHNNKDTINKY